MNGGLQIGKVAEQAGVSVDAIRFYERQRLLGRPARSEGGFRLFGVEAVNRVLFIRRAQTLGFSLPEIREILVLQGDETRACSQMRERLRAKLSTVREKMRELGALEAHLAKELQKCERNLKGTRKIKKDGCPVLREIANGDSNED